MAFIHKSKVVKCPSCLLPCVYWQSSTGRVYLANCYLRGTFVRPPAGQVYFDPGQVHSCKRKRRREGHQKEGNVRVNSDCYADAAAKIGEPFQNICRGENQPDEIVRACEESISRARKFIGKIESLKTKALKADLSNA